MNSLKNLLKPKEESYFKKHIFDGEDFKKQYQREKEFLLKLKSQSIDAESKEVSILSETIQEKIVTLLQRPDLREPIKRSLKQSDRIKQVKKILEEILEGDYQTTIENKFELGLKISLGLLTEGVVTAPIDGLVQARIDPQLNFPRLIFAGPIRAAGGSNLILLIVIAEYLRIKLGLAAYKPTEEEVSRCVSEILQYGKLYPGQIRPSPRELELAIRNCTIMIDGVATELEEVSIHKNLPRIKTAFIRGPIALIFNEGFILRAKKMGNLISEFENVNWQTWLEELIALGASVRKEGSREESESELKLVLGKPCLSSNKSLSGFRIRIGNTPTVGLSGCNVSPEVIDLLRFINVGTQLIVDNPGKGLVITGVCEDLQKPIVCYENGELGYYRIGKHDEVKKILDWGEILISAGDYVEFNKPIPIRDYCKGLWRWDTKNQVDPQILPLKEHLTLHNRYPGVKLYPEYGLLIEALSISEYLELRQFFLNNQGVNERVNENVIKILNKLQVFYHHENNTLHIKNKEILEHYLLLDKEVNYYDYQECVYNKDFEKGSKLTYYINEKLAESGKILVPERGFYVLNARVGRSQAVSISKMRPRAYNSLFRFRPYKKTDTFWKGIQKKPKVYNEFYLRYCYDCSEETHLKNCPLCSKETKFVFKCKNNTDDNNYNYYEVTAKNLKANENRQLKKYIPVIIDYEQELKKLTALGLPISPVSKMNKECPIKPVNGKGEKVYTLEPLIKGYLRSKHKLFVTKDGSIRSTFSNASTTRFTPRMANVSCSDLKKLGYLYDENNEELKDIDQVLILKFNDTLISYKTADVLIKTGNFVDLLIEKYYQGPPNYHNFNEAKDLLGTLVKMISPHTSNAILERVIGFVTNHCVYTHPLAVVARRRDIDGDMDAVMLNTDVILNCSKKFVPELKRGALMSVPLTATTSYQIDQVGKEIGYIEIGSNYYDGALKNDTKYTPADLKKILKCYNEYKRKIIKEADICYNTKKFKLDVGHYENLYKDAESTVIKMEQLLKLQEKVAFVDQHQVIIGLIEGAFLPDFKGNLKAYFSQDYKCDFCDYKYETMPFTDVCMKCKTGVIKPTVYPKMVVKYLPLLEKFKDEPYIPIYTKQKLNYILEVANSFRNSSALEGLTKGLNL